MKREPHWSDIILRSSIRRSDIAYVKWIEPNNHQLCIFVWSSMEDINAIIDPPVDTNYVWYVFKNDRRTRIIRQHQNPINQDLHRLFDHYSKIYPEPQIENGTRDNDSDLKHFFTAFDQWTSSIYLFRTPLDLIFHHTPEKIKHMLTLSGKRGFKLYGLPNWTDHDYNIDIPSDARLVKIHQPPQN